MPNATHFFKIQKSLSMAEAIENNNIDIIKRLAQSIDINSVGERGMTFLMWSIAKEKFIATKILLNLGANPNVAVEDSYPLAIASLQDGTQLLKILIEHNVNINKTHNKSPIWFEVIYAHNWMHLEMLIDAGVNVNAQNGVGQTAIMKLAQMKQYEKIIYLISKGADVTAGLNTINSFAYKVQVNSVQKNDSEYASYIQVLALLTEKGVTLPVKSPQEIRTMQTNGVKP